MNVAILAPELALGAAAAIILLGEALSRGGMSRQAAVTIAAIGLVAAALILIPTLVVEDVSFSGAFRVDAFTSYLKLLLIAATLLVLLASGRFLDDLQAHHSESVALVALATAALMMLVSATELITLYLSLEMASLATVFLAAWAKRDTRSTEAGLKFFLLNALSSAILLYGMAILYGLTGHTRLEAIGAALTAQTGPAALLAISLLIAGFGFKISAVPFQMWTPDVYEGAPTPITAYLSVASKAAGFAVAIRVFQTALGAMTADWVLLIALVAAVTMTIGNIVALAQSNIKRMLAYSSIAQAGYILVGIAAASDRGTGAVLFYLAAYTATNLAAFIAVIEIAGRAGSEQIDDFAGLHQRTPWLAFGLAISLLSLAGLPPLAGFFAKIYVFWAAVEAGLGWLVVVGVLNSALSLYYYAQIIHHMYVLPGRETAPGPTPAHPLIATALGVAVIGTFALGILSGAFLDLASVAARTLGT